MIKLSELNKDGRLNVVWSDKQRCHITKESLINYLDNMELFYKRRIASPKHYLCASFYI